MDDSIRFDSMRCIYHAAGFLIVVVVVVVVVVVSGRRCREERVDGLKG